MFDRRTFLAGSVAGAATFFNADSTEAAESRTGTDGYQYRLPAFKKGSRLLFQGDSITDMKWGRNQKDRNHYLGHSYVYLIAARLGVDMPEAQLDFYNRGNSGNTVADLRRRWQKDAIDIQPDLLSVLIGTNDAGRNPGGIDVRKWETDYRFILDASRKANPELRIVLMDPFIVASGRLANPEAFRQRRDQTDRLIPIVKQLAVDYGAVHIPTQMIFDDACKAVSPEHWIWDGVHPLPQGHELIARSWIKQISARWGSEKSEIVKNHRDDE